MPDDQANQDQGAPVSSPEAFMSATEAPEQVGAEVEEQSDVQTDESTSVEETTEESVEDQLRAQLATANATAADAQRRTDELNQSYTQAKQAEAEQRRQEEQSTDYTQYPEESRSAMQELDRRIDERAQQIVESKFGNLNGQVEQLTESQQRAVEMAAIKVKYPGVSEAAIDEAFNSSVSTREFIARGLSGNSAAAVATAKTKADLTRKKKANTGGGTGGTAQQGLGWVYDTKNPDHQKMTAMEIMRKSRENYHE